MRIGFYSTSLPEPGRKPGGVDVYVHRLANSLAQRGHHLHMVTLSPAPADAAYEVERLDHAEWRYRKIARIAAVPWLLNRRTPDVDVLHLHGDDWFYLRRTVPTVRTFYGSARREAQHAERPRRRAAQSLVFGLELLSARLATATYGIAPGDEGPYRQVGLLPIGMAPRPAVAKDERPTIVFVGTWGGRKRGALLAHAFSEHVRPRVPRARLVMISDRCEPAPGIEHVVAPPEAELLARISSAWCLCLPSTYEGFGIPYLEALAGGTAVVATPNLGARHVLDGGRAGLLVGDEDLGDALVQVLSDEPLRAGLVERGRVRAGDFAWDRVVALHEQAYAAAVQRAAA